MRQNSLTEFRSGFLKQTCPSLVLATLVLCISTAMAHTYSVMHVFPGTSDTNSLQTGVCLSGSTIYGTTYGGGYGFGTVYKIQIDGTGLETLMDFPPGNEAHPCCVPVLSGRTLYGVTSGSRPTSGDNWGTLYSIEIDGSSYRILRVLDKKPTGSAPRGARLVVDGDMLYGTMPYGAAAFGTVFRMNIGLYQGI